MPNTHPLRIALLTNTASVSEWQFQMLEKIQQEGTGNVVLAVVRDAATISSVEPKPSSLAKMLFYRYTLWDRKNFRENPDPHAMRSLDDLNKSIETIKMVPETTQWVDRISSSDAQTLREHNIDVIIRLGWRILKGEVLTIPPCGVWSFHHGDNQVNRGGPPAVWEHYHDQILAGITLQILNERLDDGLVIGRSFTARDRCSPTKTRHRQYWRSVDMLPRKLAELQHLGIDEFINAAKSRNPPVSFYSQPLLTEKNISLRQALRYVTTNIVNYAKLAIFRKRFEEKWILYFKLDDDLSTAPWQFTLLETPNDRYWADPHIIKRDGIFYVFVEEFMYDTNRGHITVIPIDENGTVGEAQTVLAADYHLSYPFVFEHEGETYMVPESVANHSIDLYKCESFPDKWVHVKTLMSNVYAVDTTLYEKDGRWWMFTNKSDAEGGITHDELYVFSANHFLDDEWIPHQQRVVVSDPRTARPAGALFESDGRLFRPAQDCSVDYGYAVQLHEITELSQEEYKEIPVSRITPDWNDRIVGVHTLAYVPGMTIIDAKTYIKKSQVIK